MIIPKKQLAQQGKAPYKFKKNKTIPQRSSSAIWASNITMLNNSNNPWNLNQQSEVNATLIYFSKLATNSCLKHTQSLWSSNRLATF